MKIATLGMLLFLFGCQNSKINNLNSKETKAKIEYFGNTQGTTYTIICNDDIQLDKKEIDSLLYVFDQELSIYVDSSVISKFNDLNSGEITYYSDNNYFKNCLLYAEKIFTLSEGLFDPSILPLVDAWSFYKKKRNEIPDSLSIDSLRSLVSFENGKHFI